MRASGSRTPPRRTPSRTPRRALTPIEPFQIYVKPMKGKRVLIDVVWSDTIDIVKAKIQVQNNNADPANQGGIPPEEQQLSFNGEKLDDGRYTLAHHNVLHKSTLLLRWDVEDET